MPFPSSKTTFVHPLREHPDNTNQHRVLASPMQFFDSSENNDVVGLNGEVNLKNMDEIKTAYLDNLNSVHSKLFAGVEEIQKWKTSVEMESKQKNKKVEELLQTIEVQRKTILDLQIQNEDLSYQLSEEIQQRSFVLEKLHSTKELCSALKKHYSTLQGHFDYRNKIEEGFNFADAKRLSAIENLQNKLERVCREHSERVAYLNDALASETNKALNLKETLEQQITIFENEKESLCKMIENEQMEFRKFSAELNEEKNKSKLAMEEKNTLKFKNKELENLIEVHSSNLKETEETLRITQNEKLELEKKLLSEKTKSNNYEKEYEQCFEALKSQEKESEKIVSTLNENISSYEIKIQKIETEMNEEKERNEILSSTISILQKEIGNLELIISEAKDELTSYEQLKKDYKDLEEQASEFLEKEKSCMITIENLNNKFLELKLEKERDSELRNENDEYLKKMCEDYQNKIDFVKEKLKSSEESNIELLNKIKLLEDDLNMKVSDVFSRDEKIYDLESAVDTCEKQLEDLKSENLTLTVKLEAEKDRICLECEILTSQLKEMDNLTLTLKKAEDDLQKQKSEKMEIIQLLNDTETSYNNDRIVKEKEIIKCQELVRRLEDEMRMMNVKVEEFNALKSLNQKQREEIEELKLHITKQEDEINELNSENEELKENIENFKNFTKEELNEMKSENEKLKENLESFKRLTAEEASLKENKENIPQPITVEDENKFSEAKKNTVPKISAEKRKRKTKSREQSQNRSTKEESVFYGLTKSACEKKDTEKIRPKLLKDNSVDSKSSDGSVKIITEIPKKILKDDAAVVTGSNLNPQKTVKSRSPHLDKSKWEVESSGSEYLELVYDKKSREQSQNRSTKEESVFYGLTKSACERKDTAKIRPKLLKDNSVDSKSSDGSVKIITEVPKKILKDDAAVVTGSNLIPQKTVKSRSSHLDKGKWEVESSGSEYLELEYDKESEKVTGLTPQKSPSIKPNSFSSNKFTPINSRFKRDSQNLNSDAKTFGLPLKKNKVELGSTTWMQPLRTPDRNVDFWRANLQKGTPGFTTPSTPADRRKGPSNVSTPSGEKKFFKTPLTDRENKFKKPQASWSDFLKSSK